MLAIAFTEAPAGRLQGPSRRLGRPRLLDRHLPLASPLASPLAQSGKITPGERRESDNSCGRGHICRATVGDELCHAKEAVGIIELRRAPLAALA
jgi:hypothetical protein